MTKTLCTNAETLQRQKVIHKLLTHAEIGLDWFEANMIQANLGKLRFMVTGNI